MFSVGFLGCFGVGFMVLFSCSWGCFLSPFLLSFPFFLLSPFSVIVGLGVSM